MLNKMYCVRPSLAASLAPLLPALDAPASAAAVERGATLQPFQQLRKKQLPLTQLENYALLRTFIATGR